MGAIGVIDFICDPNHNHDPKVVQNSHLKFPILHEHTHEHIRTHTHTQHIRTTQIKKMNVLPILFAVASAANSPSVVVELCSLRFPKDQKLNIDRTVYDRC